MGYDDKKRKSSLTRLQKRKLRFATSGRAQCHNMKAKVLSDMRELGGLCKQQYSEGRIPSFWKQGTLK